MAMYMCIRYSNTNCVSILHFRQAVNYLRERVLVKEFTYKILHNLHIRYKITV